MIDTHAHLDFPQYEEDRGAVLERAWEAGLAAIITIGVDEAASRRAIALAETDPRIYAAVGIHPHEAGKVTGAVETSLRPLAQHPRVVAVGETGLDYYYPQPAPAAQKELFRRQIRLSREVGLPLIIHSRDAHEDVLSMLREEGAAEVGGVMHCFAGDFAVAAAAMELGFYISFSGIVTFKSAGQIKEVAGSVPAERLLVETDCPFLAPHPFRGERNEPARVSLVVEEIARQRNSPAGDIAALSAANARRLFRLAEADS